MYSEITKRITDIVSKNFHANGIGDDQYDIEIGYDCVEITLDTRVILSTELTNELENEFKTDLFTHIHLDNDGNFKLVYDVSSIILEVCGTWDAYEGILMEG